MWLGIGKASPRANIIPCASVSLHYYVFFFFFLFALLFRLSAFFYNLEYVGEIAQVEHVVKLDDRRQKGRGDLLVKIYRGVYDEIREFLHARMKSVQRIRHVLMQYLRIYRNERLGLWKTTTVDN